MDFQLFEILREYPTSDGGIALEAFGPDGERVTIWPGPPPESPKIHPLVPIAIGSGLLNDAPIWVELRPGAMVLADIFERANASDRIQWAAQISDAIAALHANARCHGNIDAKAVVLDASGTPFLIGAGRAEGSPEDDILAMIGLAKQLAPDADLSDKTPSAAALSARLREGAAKIQERTPVQLPSNEDPKPIRTVSIELIPTGPMDEVHVDIGADVVGPGLLDRWNTNEDGDEFTEDPTESVDRSLLHTGSRQTMLTAMDHQLGDVISKLHNRGIAPDTEFRNVILREAPDPLPIAEGLPHGALYNPEGEAERTAEVPGTPTFTETTSGGEETTGVTNTTWIQASLMTGLWAAVVVGMVGAVIMLILVWLIIDGAF